MIDNDLKLGLAALMAGVGLLFTMIVTLVAIDAYRDCQYIKAGYTHKMLPGACRPQWVKEPPCGLCGADSKENK